jgi:hypothetical protein
MSAKKLTIMVSSTVYGIEELLERIYTLLTEFGYEVWMSHKGTLPVISSRSAFDNCINGVEKCDLFLGLITPFYGSGQEKGKISITHQELRKALELNKPRWLLVHDHVVFARLLLQNLGYRDQTARDKLKLKKSPILDDLRVIDMYEESTLIESGIPINERQGNWVQKFNSDNEAALFTSSQFFRYQEVEQFLRENFSDPNKIVRHLTQGGNDEN